MVAVPRPPLVAVVEDDPVSRTTLGRVLRIAGFEPELFESAEAFLATPPSRAPLCLILDIQLRGMSGIDLQRKLRGEGSDVPIVVTTGNREESLKQRAQKQGCRSVLWKPFNSRTLLAILSSISEESRP